jgi:hypothetical protein
VRNRAASPTVLAVVVGAILVAVGLATAVLVTRPSSGSPTPETTPPLTGAYATANPPGASIGIEPAICALEQQPGPADPVPQAGGDLMDVADLGNGRWRLCLAGPEVLVVEGSAQCTWTDDRSAVIEIVGLPLDDGSGSKVDGGVSLDPAGVYLGLTSQAGDILSFDGADRPQQIDAAADGRTGAANFALGSVVDPEHPPSVIPADRTGTLRWSCGKPPGPRPGRATGRVDLTLDDPVAGTWHVAATCRWVTTPTGGRMWHVETDPSAIRRDGVMLGIAVEVDPSKPERSEPSLWVDIGSAGDFYGTTDRPTVVRQARNGSSGLLRFRHLTISPGSDVRIADDIRDVSGEVSWVCLPPAAAGPEVGQQPSGDLP